MIDIDVFHDVVSILPMDSYGAVRYEDLTYALEVVASIDDWRSDARRDGNAGKIG